MLEHEGDYNDLSPKLRKILEERVNSFPKTVRYKFNLAHKNPDPQQYNGAIVYPSLYNLDPIQWKITDKDEDRPSRQKLKNIGIVVSSLKDDRGNPAYKFLRIKVRDIDKGILRFDMTDEEDKTKVAALELHPKNGNGLFPNAQMVSMFKRIDESQLAAEKRAERSARKTALDIVESMSDKEVADFADAMIWDSTEEPNLLRNRVEEFAETEPDSFNALVSSDKMKVKALIKKGIDNRILSHNQAEGSLAWTSTGQQIISLGLSNDEKNDVERFADWMIESGQKGDVAFKKLKSMINKELIVN